MKHKSNIFLYLGVFFIGLFMTFSMLIGTKFFQEHLTQEYNMTLKQYISSIVKHYPNLSEEEIIAILNDTDSFEETIDYNKYGIPDTSFLVAKQNELFNKYFRYVLLVIFITILLFLAFIFFYRLKRRRNIEEIRDLIMKINARIYDLDIALNSEDEFSLVRNELYKTMIMLKEEAFNSQAEKERIKELVANISHQLKTPLTSITILINNIIEDTSMPKETRNKFLNDIKKQINNLNNLVIDMLNMARFEAGVMRLKNESIDVLSLLYDIKDTLEPLLDLKDIEMSIEGTKAMIQGDYRWLKEALTNIIKNGIEYSKPHDTLRIMVISNALFTKIVIQDYGPGISPQELKHIFTRFYRSNTSDDNNFGIGLALAKMIIEHTGGIISLKSKLKQGTTFTIKYLKK